MTALLRLLRALVRALGLMKPAARVCQRRLTGTHIGCWCIGTGRDGYVHQPCPPDPRGHK